MHQRFCACHSAKACDPPGGVAPLATPMFIFSKSYARTLPPRLPNHPPKNLRRQTRLPPAHLGVVAPGAVVPVHCAMQRASTEASSLHCADVPPTGSGFSAEPSKNPRPQKRGATGGPAMARSPAPRPRCYECLWHKVGSLEVQMTWLHLKWIHQFQNASMHQRLY